MGTDRIDRVARDVFGFESLRPGQRKGIEAALAGRDALCVLSTGSGKSAIYQIAGILTPGATLVISPLISLQRDQVEALRTRKDAAGDAGQLNSSVSASERKRTLDALAGEALEFVFCAPEQLARADVREELAAADVSLIVVDEAHCVSEWGHDFRPEYLRIAEFAAALGGPAGRPPILALTATAAPPVRDEIVERLELRDPAIVVRGFDRPNLDLAVERFDGDGAAERKRRALREQVTALAPPGIVYVATRRGSEELAEALCADGVRAAAYHAGLGARERDDVQARFMDDELDVVCATTAFGMGIDKPGVRWVAHAEVSESVDSYFQEIGRAGRDGGSARALLFYRPEDLGLRRFHSSGGHVELDEIAQVLELVRGGESDVGAIREAADLSETRATNALTRLEEAGAVVLEDGAAVPAPGAPAPSAAVRAAAEAEEKRRSYDRSRVDMMRAYAETDGCRRAFVLGYFGEPFTPPCGACDNCREGRVQAPPGDVPFAVGARVRHERWGSGVVQRYEDDAVAVLFDELGYKTLALDLVRERGLLTPAASG